MHQIPNGYDYLHDKRPNGHNYPVEKEPDPDTISRIGDFLATCCTLLVACINTINTVNDENIQKSHFDSLDAKKVCACYIFDNNLKFKFGTNNFFSINFTE